MGIRYFVFPSFSFPDSRHLSAVLQVKSRASHMLGKCPTPELHALPLFRLQDYLQFHTYMSRNMCPYG